MINNESSANPQVADLSGQSKSSLKIQPDIQKEEAKLEVPPQDAKKDTVTTKLDTEAQKNQSQDKD